MNTTQEHSERVVAALTLQSVIDGREVTAAVEIMACGCIKAGAFMTEDDSGEFALVPVDERSNAMLQLGLQAIAAARAAYMRRIHPADDAFLSEVRAAAQAATTGAH